MLIDDLRVRKESAPSHHCHIWVDLDSVLHLDRLKLSDNYKFAQAPPNDPEFLFNVFAAVANLARKHDVIDSGGLESTVEAKTTDYPQPQHLAALNH